MAISDQLTLLNNTKQAIKDSINAKGGSITENTPFADYSTAIDNLPSGGGSGNKLLTTIDVSEFSGTTFNDARSYITSATIPTGVTSIANAAFQNAGITSITIPNTVTSIGAGAFWGCTGLTSISMSTNLGIISANLFYKCTGLTSFVIPNSVTQIKQTAFQDCTGLTNIIIPNSVTIIENQVFQNCSGLKTATIGTGLTQFNGGGAFQGCTNLQYIISLPTNPPTMNVATVFNNTNDCPIYVPSASVAAYKAASGWSTYENRIFGFEQVATVDGNPVYSFELGMSDMTDISSQQLAAIPSGDVIEISEGISTIWGQFGAYEEITLPSTITVLFDADSIGASTTTLTCKSTTPPTVQQDSIGGANLTAIYVPASAVSTYQSNPAFSSFSSIIQAIPS